MNKYTYDDFVPGKITEFPRRIKNVSLYDANGNLINYRSAHSGEDMKLTVCPRKESESGHMGYVGWFENNKEDSVVVFGPEEYFVVEE